MFKKILVPLDGSALAGSILPAVSDLAKCTNAEVTLIHVCYFPVTTGDVVAPPDPSQRIEIRDIAWTKRSP